VLTAGAGRNHALARGGAALGKGATPPRIVAEDGAPSRIGDGEPRSRVVSADGRGGGQGGWVGLGFWRIYSAQEGGFSGLVDGPAAWWTETGLVQPENIGFGWGFQ